MIKKNIHHLIISSFLILVPTLFGVIFWDKLPANMTSHWGTNGTPDGISSKAFCVFGIPLIMLALHLFCIFFTALDKKNKDQNQKMFRLIFYIVPVVAFYSLSIVYMNAFGYTFELSKLTLILIGAMFVILGNFLPKCKQNTTLGIKLPWTITNEENWNETHRLGGKLWVASGIAMFLSVFLPTTVMIVVIISVILVAAIVPTVYSYCIYRKALKNGEPTLKINSRDNIMMIIVILVVIILFICAFIFGDSGNIEYDFNDKSFDITASYWQDISINYSDIDSVEFLDVCDAGIRTNGFGGTKILLGEFENNQFGAYTRYTYTYIESCVLIIVDGNELIINGETQNATEEIFKTISDKVQ